MMVQYVQSSVSLLNAFVFTFSVHACRVKYEKNKTLDSRQLCQELPLQNAVL